MVKSGFVTAAVAAATVFFGSVQAKELGVNEITWTHTNGEGREMVDLYVFWSRDCAHCHKAMPFLKTLETRYPWVKLHMKELERNSGPVRNQYHAMAQALGEQAWSIPAFFFCKRLYMGWVDAETTGTWLVDRMSQCRGKG